MEIKTEDIIKLFGEEMNSGAFIWDDYCCKVGEHIGRVFPEDIDFSRPSPNYQVLGWSYANKIPVRPKTNGVVVMYWNNKEEYQFWMHVCDSIIQTMIDINERRSL